MSNTHDPNQPGFNLTTVKVADRNAKAAIEIAQMARKDSSESRQRIVQLEAEVVALKNVIEQIRIQTVTLFGKMSGGGPTAS